MRTAAQQLGDAAEAVVADRLAALGWVVHARNVRVGRAEIDLIATDPGPPRTLVFVEVRWRARRDFGLAEETVDHRKRDRLHRAAFALIGEAGPARGENWNAGGTPTAGTPTAGTPTAGTPTAGTPTETPALPRLPMRFDLVVVEPGGRMRHHRHGS